MTGSTPSRSKPQPIQVIDDQAREEKRIKFEAEIDVEIQRSKDAGEWTWCDENGHDLEPFDPKGAIVCKRCGVLATKKWLDELHGEAEDNERGR